MLKWSPVISLQRIHSISAMCAANNTHRTINVLYKGDTREYCWKQFQTAIWIKGWDRTVRFRNSESEIHTTPLLHSANSDVRLMRGQYCLFWVPSIRYYQSVRNDCQLREVVNWGMNFQGLQSLLTIKQFLTNSLVLRVALLFVYVSIATSSRCTAKCEKWGCLVLASSVCTI